MSKKLIEIDQLIAKTMEEMLKSGMAKQTVWSAGYYGCYRMISKYYHQQNQETYSDNIMNDYAALLASRFEAGEICRGYYRCHQKAIERLREIYETGQLSWQY